MSNIITIELCAEDRARLDKLTAALEKSATGAQQKPDPEQDELQQKLAGTLSKANTPTDAPKNAAGETEAPTPPVIPAEEETPKPEQGEPAVTLAQIQQKVVQLAAGQNGAKKAKVREIINTYGAKVSDLKEQPDKWGEVWDKLTALENEG